MHCWSRALLMISLLLTAPLHAASGRLAVSSFRADGVDAALGRQVAELLAIELAKFEGVEVLTPADLQGMLDQAARAQLLGCEQPECFVDLAGVVAAPRLLTGAVGQLDGRLVVQAAIIDLATGQATARASLPLAADGEALTAGLKSMAVVLVTGDPSLAPPELVAKGEVTSALLERVRIGQRDKGVAVHLLGGGLLAASALATSGMPPSNMGAAGRLQLGVPLLPWLQLIGALGGGYYTGRIRNNETYATLSSAGDSTLALGTRTADFAVSDLALELGVKLRPAYGLVLPYALLAVSADGLALDVSDLVYRPDPDSPAEPPALWAAPIPFRQSLAPGGGLRVAAGVDFMLLDALGASLELSLTGKLHGLELISLINNVEQRVAFAPLVGSQLMAAVFWQF